MKKISLIIILLIIISVRMANAIKYQISCDLVFSDQVKFCEAWDYLDSKRDLGFQDIKDEGDKIEPSRQSIDLLKNREESVAERPHRLKVKLRLDSREERDKIWYFLLTQKPFVASKTPGRIEKHTCGHDEEKPCTQQETESWCQEVEL